MHGPRKGTARLRGVFAVVAALGALAALGVLAGASWSATGSSSANQYQYHGKVTICHHTHSKKHPFVTITVGAAAVKAHLKHGDTLGACGSKTTTSTSTSTSTSTTTTGTSGGHGKGHGGGNGHGHH